MNYINEIAYHLGERSEVPNQVLAKKLADGDSSEGIKEIASYLFDKNKSVASDCLKVLYETGYIKPELIAPYTDEFIKLLSSKENRMVWGAMIALACCANVVPKEVYKQKDFIMALIETGTVITNVWGVKTLINIAKNEAKLYSELKSDLFELQKSCRPVDFAKRAEDMMGAIPASDVKEYISILEAGKKDLSSAGAKRADGVIRKLNKKTNK